MYISETYAKKWAPVLDHPELPGITDPYKRAVTALVLENQEAALRQENAAKQNLWEAGSGTAPTSIMGAGINGLATATGGIQGFDPIMIGLVRRAMPNLMAYDLAGVQPMTGPTGLIFAMRSSYVNSTGLPGTRGVVPGSADEAFYDEAKTGHSGNTPGGVENTLDLDLTDLTLANTGNAFSTAFGESANLNSMSFQIDRVAVEAKTRGLQASYSLELAQDLKAVHGLDAETELSNILSTEILAEINREVVRSIYATAAIGMVDADHWKVDLSENTATSAANTVGTSGRWQVERYKALLFQIERACNKIAKDTRRGKGNMLVVSTDVASALAMTGLLDYQGALTNNTNLAVDDTGNTFAGTLFGRLRVYVDPYSVTGKEFIVVGYKGTTPYDAGLFYCPYVPLQMVRAIDPVTYQPKIGFKTRYGMVANPFAASAQNAPAATSGALVDHSNRYYRKFLVQNLAQ